MQVLKQSTAVDVLIGPFVDITDGITGETGESPSVKLSKNGQALGAKNDVTTPVSDADGYYNCELDATDTDTVGTMVLTVAATATAAPVRHEFQVIEEAVYDAMYAASAAGPLQSTTAGRTLDVTATGAAGIDWGNVENPTTAVDLSATDIQLCDTVTTNTDMRGTDSAATAASLTTAQNDLDILTGTDGATLATAQGNYAPAKAGDSMALAAGAITDASLAGNMEIVFETDFATNYNATRNAWATNVQDFVGTSAADPFNGQVVSASVTGAVGSVTGAVGSVAGNVDGNVTGSVGSNLELGPAEVNAEVLDVLNTDTFAEPAQGAPGATVSLATKIGFLYKAWRNKSTQTATEYALYNDDASTVDHKATVSDDTTTATKGEVATGP